MKFNPIKITASLPSPHGYNISQRLFTTSSLICYIHCSQRIVENWSNPSFKCKRRNCFLITFSAPSLLVEAYKSLDKIVASILNVGLVYIHFFVLFWTLEGKVCIKNELKGHPKKKYLYNRQEESLNAIIHPFNIKNEIKNCWYKASNWRGCTQKIWDGKECRSKQIGLLQDVIIIVISSILIKFRIGMEVTNGTLGRKVRTRYLYGTYGLFLHFWSDLSSLNL